MLTPPYHFSIVACPLAPASPDEVLYRGALPAERNIGFLNRLRVKTLLYLRETPLSDDATIASWAQGRNVDLRCIAAKEMTEEKLGLGKTEMGEIIKVILDPAAYPLYLADSNGTSHTTLVVACLRKLQGWHIDSIIGEICRFEPEYEDYSLVPFITSYLSGQDASFSLPPGPHPTWLWPQLPTGLVFTRTDTRERTVSASATSPSTLLPFPHPLQIRKHPTMKITFPTPATTTSAQGPLSPSNNQNRNPLSRVSTRTGKPGDENASVVEKQPVTGIDGVLSGVSGAMGIPEGSETRTLPQNNLSSSPNQTSFSGGTSPDKLDLQRELTYSSQTSYPEGESSESDPQATPDDDDEGDDDETEYEEEEEDEDEDDEELQPTSQYISALDLAGFG